MKRPYIAVVLSLSLAASGTAQVIRTNPAFNANSIPRNDDGSSSITPLGFTVNFFGKMRSDAYVNNNGNITFDAALPTYTPFGLQRTSREIIAPFFSDVDTRPAKSRLVTYGQDVIGGRKVFGVNYIDVGYYNQHDDKLNTFQLVVTERADTGPGNFDIEFNYGRIAWETGDASGGVNGFGGVPAVVGWSNGTTDSGTSFELPGSMISGAFLDNGPQSLVRTRLNNSVVGRLVFRARDGVLSPGLTIQTGPVLPDGVVGQRYSYRLESAGAEGAQKWELIPDVILPPGLTVSADGSISGSPTAVGTYGLTAALTSTIDGEAQTVYRRVLINVKAAKLAIATACPLPDGIVGSVYSTSFRSAGTTLPVLWSVKDRAALPAGLALSPAGLIGGVPQTPGNYDFVIRAETGDPTIQPAENSCRLTIRPAAVSLAGGCLLPDGFAGVPYAQDLTPSGGIPPYRFNLAGQLPPGVALSAAGRISGIPAVAARYPFSISIADSRGMVSQAACSFEVRASSIDIKSACPLPSGATSQSYRAVLDAQGGAGPFVWSVAGNLPPGLTLTPEGIISGRPTAAGPYLFRLILNDSQGEPSAKPCSISIARGPLSVGSCPLPEANAGDSYRAQLNGVGGTEPYLWNASGALPPGVTVTAGGIVSGVPSTPGAYEFALNLMDADGNATSQTCSMKVKAPPLRMATACPVRTGTLGQFYTMRLAASGGTAPYAFRVSGTLPAGIAASSDGTLSGTPGAVGTNSFRVMTSDSAGASVENLCSIEIGLPTLPVIRIGSLPATVAPATPGYPLTIETSSPYSLPITGVVSVAIAPDARNRDGLANQADPRVRFGNGQLSTSFTIAAGATKASVPMLTTGTVASALTVSLSNLRAGGTEVSAAVAPRVFRVPAAAPVISSACYTTSASGSELVVLGFSSTRELVRLEAVSGSETIQSSIESASAEFFGREETIRSGGAFSLRIPVTFKAVPASTVNVRLANTEGLSAQAAAQRCQ